MTQLNADHRAIFDRLKGELTTLRPTLDLLDRYYDGQQRLEQLGLAIPPELQSFTVVVNWPRVVADARTARLEVKGFSLPDGSSGVDEELWEIWQANHLDEQDAAAILDFEVQGRSYYCIGGNEDSEIPVITAESPRQVITDRDPRTGKVTAALRLYRSETTANGYDDLATLYLPNETIYLSASGGQWSVEASTAHNLGLVPVVPSFRGRRTALGPHRRFQGVSAMADVISVTDAAARNITNAQVAQETHAVPARWALGVSKGDFVDKDGNPLPEWEAYFGSIWAHGSKDAKVGQFSSSPLDNFATMRELYAREAVTVTSLPPNFFGLAADDAASAEAIKSRESAFVRSVERDQVALGNAREEVMRIAMMVKTGQRDERLSQLECKWYDAGTPTYASRVDAVVKQFAVTDAAGRPLISRQTALEELGWSPQRIERELDRLEREERIPYLNEPTG